MELQVWPVLVALVIGLLAYLHMRTHQKFKMTGVPYKISLPLLGDTWKALLRRKAFAHIIQDAYNLHPTARYVGYFDVATPVALIRDPELIKHIAVKHFDSFPDHRAFVDEVVEPLFGKNLFALRGERWRGIRQIMSPAFTSSKMKAMFILMQECAVYFTDFIAKRPVAERDTDIKDAFTRYTNDVIATCAFGISINSMKDRDNLFYVYGRDATQFDGIRTVKFFLMRLAPWLVRLMHIRLVPEEISNFFKDIVSTTIQTRDEKGITRPDMIQLMMETRGKLGPGKELTIEDMTAQAFIFFFGGFESTSTLMCFVAHEIGTNPEIQERLQDEIDSVLEDTNGKLTYEALNEMKYLDAVINEALRMYPIAVAADRLCVRKHELPPAVPGAKPYPINPGEFVWLPIYALHMDPNYFENPQKFNPDRFMDDPKKIINSGTYMPFGLGPRMCIGNRFALLETKTLLFNLLARVNLKPCSKTVVPLVLNRKGLAMTAEDGFWLKIEPRSKPHPSIANSMQNGTANVTANGTAK